MAMHEYEEIITRMENLRYTIRQVEETSNTGMHQIYNRLQSLEETVVALYEVQKQQTELLQQIVAAMPGNCVFPKGVGLEEAFK